MKRLSAVLVLTMVLMVLVASPLAPVQPLSADGPVLNPANGHYYDVIPSRYTWEQAREDAAARSYTCGDQPVNGYLVTITSAEENLFVTDLLVQAGVAYAWLGGFQYPPTADPAANWQWVTGEPWAYTNWQPGDPNDFGGSDENVLEMWPNTNADGRRWNDEDVFLDPYVVEYECPQDNDHDGVSDDLDYCPATAIPEGAPTEKLGVNRWALVDGDGMFDTTAPDGKGPDRSYSIVATAGCSCEQIIEQMGLGEGHTKFGCSISAMDDWISYVGAP